MNNRKRFPDKDSEFNNYLNNVIPYLVAEAARLQITTARTTTLTDLKTAWDDKYPKSQNTNIATKTIVDEKNALRATLEQELRDTFDDIPKSLLTSADRNTLNLPERDATPTKRGKIDTKPGVILKLQAGEGVWVECRVSEDSSRASRHPDSDGVMYRYTLAAPATAANTAPPAGNTGTPGTPGTTPPVASAPVYVTGINSKARFFIAIAEADLLKVMTLQCQWLNSTDNKKNSGWSNPVSINLA